MNPIIKKSTDWIKSHKKLSISLACVTLSMIISIPIIAITSNKNNQVNNNNLSNSSYDSSSSSSESSSSSDSSSDESSSSLNEGDIDTDTDNSSSSYDAETSSSSNSTGENTTSSTPSKQPTSNGGNSSTKPNPPTPTPTPPAPPKPPTSPPVAQRTWEYMPTLSRQTFDLMNKFRQDNGVAPLLWNETCNGRAKKQAESNAIRQGIQHGGGQIALNNSIGTAESFIKQWSDSPGHKNNMLDTKITDMAVSVYKDSNGRFYVVADMTNDFWNDLFE